MSKIDDSNITANKFLASKALKSALNEAGLRTLAAGHPALLQRNRIENLIRFWKIDTYPSGLDLAAVELEYETQCRQNSDDCCIQDIFTYGKEDERFLVTCMLKEQAELFQKMEFIEVDMSMKRLKGDVNKEIIVACQNFDHGKIEIERLTLSVVEILTRDDYFSIDVSLEPFHAHIDFYEFHFLEQFRLLFEHTGH
ncbi:hypothetical protein E4U14_002557 [Claviceps sp. LM454 group G7]|nr:hypothetical protein E4U14_002557 [Claviceps sp. LM454 group G7]